MGAPSLGELMRSGRVWRSSAAAATAPVWSFAGLDGRYVELAARGPAVRLTCAAQLVLEAQLAREPAAWVTATASSFHPPDLARNGVDLGALVVVRLPAVRAMLRAAETLLRSGAFGLVVVDLESAPAGEEVTLAVQARLIGLTQHHGALLLCLTRSDAVAPHTLASLRAEASMHLRGDGRCENRIEVVKDKRAGPGWHHTSIYQRIRV